MIPQVFRDVDIISSLGKIVDLHTKYYKDDFDMDQSIIRTLARSSDERDRHLIWLCRPLGTQCLRERDVFLEGTHENSVFRFYHEQTKDRILAYAVHLKEADDSTVKGNIYTLDYAKAVERLPYLSCPIERVTLYYPDGNEFTVPYKDMHGAVNELSKLHGDPDSFLYHPESEAELGMILRRMNVNRDRRANRGNFELHIEDLQKESLRRKLQYAKAEVKPPAQKSTKKDEQSL